MVLRSRDSLTSKLAAVPAPQHPPIGESLSMTKIASHKIASHKIISTLNTLTYPARVSDCYNDTFVVILTKTDKTLVVMPKVFLCASARIRRRRICPLRGRGVGIIGSKS